MVIHIEVGIPELPQQCLLDSWKGLPVYLQLSAFSVQLSTETCFVLRAWQDKVITQGPSEFNDLNVRTQVAP